MPGIGFCRRVDAQAQNAYWEVLREPPYLQWYSGQPFIAVAREQGGPRVFVDGLAVLGIHSVASGDWVRIVGVDGSDLSYRLGLQNGGVTEAGDGRPCAFTGLPIHGPAVRCRACDRQYAAASAAQIRTCVCGSSLEVQPPEPTPEEGLL